MSSGFLAKILGIWWAGVKVFFRWSAFWIVLVILWFPAMALTGLVGDYAGYVLGMIFFILVAPLLFYLTSKYLLLLGDSEDNRTNFTDHTGTGQESAVTRISTRRVTVVAAPIAFAFAAAILTPPDVISQIFLMAQMLLVAGVLAFIVSRFRSFAQSPENIKRLIIVLVCLLSILIPYAVMDLLRHARRPADSLIESCVPPSASYAAFSMGDLWIGYVSGRPDALFREVEYVTCSLRVSKTSNFDGSTWMFTFSDRGAFLRTGLASDEDETVWMDQQHKVTHRGPVLSKQDVSLLWNHHPDENLKISSPEELLALVKKLKTEQPASIATPAS